MSINDQLLTKVEQCIDIVKYHEIIPELAKMKAPVYKRDKSPFERQIITARKKLEEVKSNQTIYNNHKQALITRIETELQRLDKEVTEQFLNVEVRDSIDLIEKTLEEPHFYSLPHLIMWRETAQEKIEKLKNFPIPIPQELVLALIKKYESLIVRLKAEILKLRTYPIPEPWCSHLMRKGLTHLIEGEFIFFVHPGIEEDMRPLNLSERDILPGGLTRQDYDSRMNRLYKESAAAVVKFEDDIILKERSENVKWVKDSFAKVESNVTFAFTELPLLYRDGRTLEYLVNKNEEDELLKEIHNILLREIRHYHNNRINIPSVAIDSSDYPMNVAPPKEERNIPIASGVDRGATEGHQLVTPASVVVSRRTVFVADRYGHLISYYRASDLEAFGSHHYTTADTPTSLSIFGDSLFVCYSKELVKFSLSWNKGCCIHFKTSIQIEQICCTTSNNVNLFVGTVKPSLIIIMKNTYTLTIEREYQLHPVRYANRENRYPWLQDMKATQKRILCLFTGTPFPLQEFSFKGEPTRTILREDQIAGAYHFNLFRDPVTQKWRIYITHFWKNAIKVFDINGQLIEIFSEEGFGLGQIFHPTGIFIEKSGFITVCDMKEDNCLQRF